MHRREQKHVRGRAEVYKKGRAEGTAGDMHRRDAHDGGQGYALGRHSCGAVPGRPRDSDMSEHAFLQGAMFTLDMQETVVFTFQRNLKPGLAGKTDTKCLRRRQSVGKRPSGTLQEVGSAQWAGSPIAAATHSRPGTSGLSEACAL